MEQKKIIPNRSRGKPFTSETAREARQKQEEKRQREKSITKAFLHLLTDKFRDKNGVERTGAELVADAILQGSIKGNPKMIELALQLSGETPKEQSGISDGQITELIRDLQEGGETTVYAKANGADAPLADAQAEKD